MEGYRYLLTLDLLTCLIAISNAASKSVMPSVTAEWGSGEINLKCVKDEDLSRMNVSSTTLYVYKDGGEFVRRFKGKDTYVGASHGSVRLNDDGSMSLNADYSSIGTYVCKYRPKNSYIETQTKVNVLEPSLRILECNATTEPNQSQSTCQLNVPNGTRSLNFTAIKEGLRWSNGTISVELPSDVSILTETNDTTTNADNSTTKSWRYEVDVSGLTSSANLNFVLDGEEVHVVLNKAESMTSDSNLTSGQIGGVVVAIIMIIVVLGLVILYVLVRTHKISSMNCFRSRTGESAV